MREIEDTQNRVEEEFEGTELVDELFQLYQNTFQKLVEKGKTSVKVAKVDTIFLEADTLKVCFLAEISKEKKKAAKIKATQTIK